MKRVLITAPLRQDADIFDAYQDALDRLEIPEGVEVRRFYVVNDCDAVIPHIRDAEYVVMNNGDLSYRKTGDDHIWTLEQMTRMSDLRNRTVREALDGGYDYWFSVDTDVILDPRTLRTLLEADKSIVSELFWTRAPNGRYWCNAWMYDQSAGMDDTWRTPGLYRVGMTGACTLAERQVFEAGVDYTPIPNIRQALRGEDRHFCVRAACAGFEMWADTHCPPAHLYTRDLYEQWRRDRCLRK